MCGEISWASGEVTCWEISRASGEPDEGARRRDVRRDTAVRAMEGQMRDRSARAMVRQGLEPGTTTGQAGQAWASIRDYHRAGRSGRG